MSQNHPAADPSTNYQVIFDNALKAYKTKTGKDLKSDPLLRTLETCNSPDAVLVLLRQQIPGAGQSGSGDERLTNWVDPVVNVLYNFAETIGGAVSLAYPPAGVIFTGISSLLSAVMAVRATQSEIIDLFERIENFFTRLGIYIELPPTVEMTDIIVKVMVDVLLIIALVTREIKQGKTKRFLKKLMGRSDMKDALQRFDTLTQEESRMAVAQGLKATHGVGNDVRDVGDGVKVAINKVDAVTAAVLDGSENMRVELLQVARGVSDLAKDASDEKRNQMREDIENWLSPADPFINFNTANDVHYEGTAEWFTQGSTFKSWKESGSLLWIYGKPGSGKSVLSSTIIQNINGSCNIGKGLLAFFFFDFKDVGKQDARALLSSIIVQLSADQSIDFFNVLRKFYSAHRDGNQQPSISALAQCLEDMLKVQEKLPIYLIIDAIDECPNTGGVRPSRAQVLDLVKRYISLKLPNLHLCVTSRPEADIRNSLEPLTLTSNRISLHDESGQKKDIVEFVTSVVRTDENMRRWREEDRELVINTLSERAEGMFRWAFCQLETLRLSLPSSVRRILAELPETLDATYERILQEIPKTNRVHAHRLLQCLAVAYRPLVVEELAEVLAIDFDGEGEIPKLNEGFRWADQEQAVLLACSSLIAIVEHQDSRRVQFSHFSVREFLTSDRLANSELNALRYHHIHLESAHFIMSQVCLGVLFRLDDTMDKETIRGYPLGKYIGESLLEHAEAGNMLSRISDGVDSLFDPDKPHLKILGWLEDADVDASIGDIEINIDPGSDSDDSSSQQSSPDQLRPERSYPKNMPRMPHLFFVLRCSGALLKHLILKYAHDFDARDMYGKTILHVAAFSSKFEAMRMLIEHTEDINARDNWGCTPLHYAVIKGATESQDDHFNCVRLLLERGVDAEVQDKRGMTPLHLAASDEDVDEKIVQMLIEKVTDINLRNIEGQAALHIAALRGDTDIMGIILNHGADVDAQDRHGETPLHAAISKSDLPVAEQLLKHGANVDVQNQVGRTALHLALQYGDDVNIIRLLIENGANVDALDYNGSTPLHLMISIVSMHSEGPHDSETPELYKPSEGSVYSESFREAIKLLLEHGASVHRENNEGVTPFQAAGARGLQEITGWFPMHIPSERTA